MDAQTYAAAIVKRLTDPNLGDYEGFGQLASCYRKLNSISQGYMRDGLAIAISELSADKHLGALADAIHLAYHLDLFQQELVSAVEEQRHYGTEDWRVKREINNYLSYQSHQSLVH